MRGSTRMACRTPADASLSPRHRPPGTRPSSAAEVCGRWTFEQGMVERPFVAGHGSPIQRVRAILFMLPSAVFFLMVFRHWIFGR